MVVIPQRIGQLGNQLFHIAHFAASALEYQYRVKFCSFQYPIGIFPKINSNPLLRVKEASKSRNRLHHRLAKALRISLPRSPWHEFRAAHEFPHTCTGEENFIRLAKHKTLFCEGFAFRDPDQFMKHADELRTLFQFSPGIRNAVDQFIQSSGLDQHQAIVGFHIRRGDYRTYRDGEKFITDEQWIDLINKARNTFHSTDRPFRGVLFSNENVEALIQESDDLIAGPGNMFEDMEMLSRCDALIAPESTFSGWASFLGNVPLLEIDSETTKVDPAEMNPKQW